MQEIAVIISILGALAYLGYRFFGKKSSSHCDDCGFSTENQKNH